MTTKSKTQRKAALVALSVKKGDRDKSVLKGASKDMYNTLDLAALMEMSRPRKLSHRLQ